MFLAVYIFTWVVQFVMVEVGGMVTKCYPFDVCQNLICLAFGFVSIPWGFALKLIPLKYFNIKVDDKPMEEEKKNNTAVSLIRSSTIRKKEITGKLQQEILR